VDGSTSDASFFLMLATIDIEARKQTGISFQQTDEIDESGVNLVSELDVSSLEISHQSPYPLVLTYRKQF
jgi:hypothetical protein